MNDNNVPREREPGRVLDKFRRWLPRGFGRGRYPLVRFVLASAIIVMWLAIYYKAITDPTFDVPEGVSGVAIAAATYLFGSGLLNRKGDGE